MKTQSQGKYQSKYRQSKKGFKNSERQKRQIKLLNSTEQFLKIRNRDWAHQTRNTTSDHEETSQELRMLSIVTINCQVLPLLNKDFH